MVRDGNMLDIPDICELLEAELLGVVLEDEEIIISQNHGEPVIGKHTVSDTCYQNIARRIAGMEVAIPDYLHHKGMFSRFFCGIMPESWCRMCHRSKGVAKERLKLMIDSRRKQLDDETMAQIRHEIGEIVTRYVDIEPENVEIKIILKDYICSNNTN